MTKPTDVRVLGQRLSAIADDEVRLACSLVDALPNLVPLQGAVTQVLGRKRRHLVRALLVGLVLTAVHDRTAVLRRVHEMVHYRISDAARAELGIPGYARTVKGSNAGYRAVVRLFHAVIERMNPSAMLVPRTLVPRAVAQPRRKITAAEQEQAAAQLLQTVNDLLEQTWLQVPDHVRAQWRGHLGLDATPLPAYSRGRTRWSQHWPSDPDAAWYVREGDHRDDDSHPEGPAKKKRKKFVYAYEATLAVAGDIEESDYATFPRLALGMTLHKPGHAPGTNAFKVIRDIARRGHPAGLIGADRLYNDSKPENLQLPARALGYGWVFDYRDDQLGIQASSSGANQVEGSWYCPHMPLTLVEATKLYRAGLIDEQVYRARIRARAAYLLRGKENPDEEGHQRHLCPADGARGCTAVCPLKQKPAGWKPPRPLLTIHPVEPPGGWGQICTQGSITIPPLDGAKHAQDLRYGTEEQLRAYRQLRNGVEGENSYTKQGQLEGLADPSRRRVRGLAAQTLLVGVLLAASNLRRIRSFLADAEVTADNQWRTRKRRRKTTPLSAFTGEDSPAA